MDFATSQVEISIPQSDDIRKVLFDASHPDEGIHDPKADLTSGA
jgi:hypothetical protein